MLLSLAGGFMLLFALMQKVTKKIKAAAIAPRAQPGQRTRDRTTGREHFLMLDRLLSVFSGVERCTLKAAFWRGMRRK
jgi:hypothetical protein